MRGFLILVLLGAALGSALIAIMINNPGYALIVWAGYRLEASPYALILLIAAATLVVFFALRFVSQLLGVLPGIGRWWRHRRQRQEHDQVRNALLELIEERYDAFDVSIPKLQRSGWLSESAALVAQRSSLRRKLIAAVKADQLKKIWRKASQVFKSETDLQVVYAQSLARVDAQSDAEKALIDLASIGWNQGATDLVCTWTLQDPRTLLTRLEGLTPAANNRKAIERAKQVLASTMPNSDP
ncbi:MAG: hypothetical protein CNF01_02675 [Halieaceae bacterium MED-G27]|nr:hypothetical protein [Halieaceae bacterium]OUT66043.1 MAG: hypothetical protein CBB81_04935 [Cellvibrionales bacterium TMED21]PDH37985.1 MAG: hypothetical protein CNF01_02675 [Halieaceae bacterium MED-G27]